MLAVPEGLDRALGAAALDELAGVEAELLECFEDPQASRANAASSEPAAAGRRIRKFTP